MKFAAIDIGSNALRLLFCNVYNEKGRVYYRKAELTRIPLRLGEDAFLLGRISDEKTDKLITSMQAFKHLIEIHEPYAYKACATSAMRDAANRYEIIDRVYKATGIAIELIDGKTEAGIIYSNHNEEQLDGDTAYLYVDIGGGSTELTLFYKNKTVVSQSFNIGTIRMLHNQIDKTYWGAFKNWIENNTSNHKPLIAVGSGGNINKLFKMSGKKPNKSITTAKIKNLYEVLESYTYEERIKILGLNPDRADVIIPAAKILLTILKKADIERVIVPQIGLVDGIVHQLYEAFIEKKTAKM